MPRPYAVSGYLQGSSLKDRGVTANLLGIDVRNETSGTLSAGTVVYLSGWSHTHQRPLISKADANAAGAKGTWILPAAMLNLTNARIGKTFHLKGTATSNVNTSATTVGDAIYLSATAGGWTKTDPFDAVTNRQKIGVVDVVSATLGEIEFNLSDDNEKLSAIDVTALAGEIDFGGTISPAALAAQTDDWAPSGLSTASIIRVSLTGNQSLTGITGGASGRMLILINVDATDSLTIVDAASSASANQFTMTSNLILLPKQGAVFIYDVTTAKWRCVGVVRDEAAAGDLAGVWPAPTVSKSSTAFAFTGVISPAAIVGALDNYAPANLSTASVLRLSAAAPQDITGLTGGAAGRVILIHNIGAGALTLKDSNGGSAAANQFALPADIVLATDAMVALFYDGTSAIWRALWTGVGPTGAAGGDLAGVYPGPTIAAAAVTSAKLQPDTIQFADVSISNADLKLLNGSPYTLVAGQVGKVIEFVGAVCILDYTAPAFDTNGTLTVIEETSTTVLSTTLSNSWLYSAADAVKTLKPIVTDVALTPGKGILLSCAAGNPATGGSVARIKVAYRVRTTGL